MNGSLERVLSKRIYFPDAPFVKEGCASSAIRRILICKQMEVVVTTAIRQCSAGWVRVTQIVITLSARGRSWRQISGRTAETNTRAVKIKIKYATFSSMPAAPAAAAANLRQHCRCLSIAHDVQGHVTRSPEVKMEEKYFLEVIKEKNISTIHDGKQTERNKIKHHSLNCGLETSHHSSGNACKSQRHFVRILEILFSFCEERNENAAGSGLNSVKAEGYWGSSLSSLQLLVVERRCADEPHQQRSGWD